MAAGLLRLGQERALNLGGELQILLEPRLFRRLAVQARAFDGGRGLGRERFERPLGRRRQQSSSFPAVQIQHTDRPLRRAPHPAGPRSEREKGRTEDVADAERQRAHVLPRQAVVRQIHEHLLLPRGEDLLRNLPARLEDLAGERRRARARGRS